MSTFMVNYDLSKPDRNYAKVEKCIKDFPSWAHPMGSNWIVVSSLSTAAVRDEIWKSMDSDDHLLVTNIHTGDSAWYNLPQDVSDWLKGNYKVA